MIFSYILRLVYHLNKHTICLKISICSVFYSANFGGSDVQNAVLHLEKFMFLLPHTPVSKGEN